MSKLCVPLERGILTTLVGSSYFPAAIKHYDSNNSDWVPYFQLRHGDFSGNKFLHTVTGGSNKIVFPHGFEHLEYLNYQNNGIKSTHHALFQNMPSLKTLLLSYNNFGLNLSNLNVREIKNLAVLDLSYNGISHIPVDYFAGDSSLRQLNLTGNKISQFNVDLGTLVHLELLNLSHNSIKTLSRSMRDALDGLGKQLTVVLTGNLLSCGCKKLSFIDWLMTTDVHIQDLNNLSCLVSTQGIYNLGTLDLEGLKRRCSGNTRLIIIWVTSTFVVTITFVLLVTTYCKRWKLMYWWYITRKGWQHLTSSTDSTQYEYDAFVAYDYRDFHWVRNELLVEMEDQRDFKLCIHHRDFPGGDILEEIIVESIHKSRKTILLLTPRFVKSRWCEFEYRIARNQLFDHGRDIIVAVILKPLPPGSVNGSLYHLLKDKLYLEWVENDEVAKQLFWRKLSDALNSKSRTHKSYQTFSA